MSKNVEGAVFVSKGIEYVLKHGLKGNLRPYTVGPVKTAMKTKNPYVIVGTIAVVAGLGMGYWIWERYRTKTAG